MVAIFLDPKHLYLPGLIDGDVSNIHLGLGTTYDPSSRRIEVSLPGIKWGAFLSPIAHSFLTEGKTGVIKLISNGIVDTSKQILLGKDPFAAYFRVDPSGNHIDVYCHFEYNNLAHQVPGHTWQKTLKCWRFTRTPATALMLAKAFAGTYVEMNDAFVETYAQSEGIVSAQAFRNAEDLPDHPSKVPSWNHQKQAYEFLSRIDCGGLFADMGTGKSKVIVDLMANRKQIKHVLIVCKKKGIGVWPREFRRYSVRGFRIVRLQGPVGGRAAAIEREWDNPKPTVFVTNYDVVWREPLASVVLDMEWDCVICDEAQKIKSAGSKVSMFMSRVADRVSMRYALTGTPMHDKPLDVYGIYRFIDKGIFGTNVTMFRNRYAIMGGYGGYEIQGYQNLDELATRMYTIAFRVTDEVLDLPEIVTLTDEFSLTKQEVATYGGMEKDMIVGIMEGSVVANNVLTKMLRLQQITSGFVKTEDGDEVTIGTSKIDLLEEQIEDLPPEDPVVVFCRFVNDLNQVKALATKMKRTYGEISGRHSDLTPDATMPKGIQIMAVQIQSGGDSVDLTRSNRAFFFSMGLSLGDYQQAIKRIHRPGQGRRTYVHHLVANGTIDADLVQMMIDKKDITSFILNYLKRKAAEEND